MNAYKILKNSILLSGLLLAAVTAGWGNNVTVTNVELGSRGSSTAPISFDLRWENSWKADYSKDAVWIFVKYRKAGTPTWHHAYLSTGGVTYGTGWSHEAGMDGAGNHALGMFIFKDDIGSSMQPLVTTRVTVQWNYKDNPERALTAGDNVEIRVYPVEMVYVKGGQGSFKLGDGGAATKSFRSAKDGSPFTLENSSNNFNLVDTFGGIKLLNVQTDSNQGNADKKLLINYQLPAGENRYAFITVVARDENKTLTNLTVGGNPLSNNDLVAKATQDKAHTYVYKFLPTQNNVQIEATLADNTESAFMSVATFDGIHQLSPVSSAVDTLGQIQKNAPLRVNKFGILWEKADLIFSAISTDKAAVTIPGGYSTISNGASKDIMYGISLKEPLNSPSDSVSFNLGDDKKFSLVSFSLKPQPQAGGFSLSGQNGLNNNNSFPTGYASFYSMKYEVTQAQYVEFLNTLDRDQQASRTETPPEGDSGDGALNLNNDYKNGIDIEQSAAGGFPAIYGCNLDGDNDFDEAASDGNPKACNYLSWDDLAAWLDWAALRPMTELEFEKLSRPITKSQTAVAYPWGLNSNPIEFSGSVSNEGGVSEQLTNKDADASSCNWGKNYEGPLRVGFFARDGGLKADRKHAGASLTGVMDLAGNLWEMVVTIETENGRGFTGNHGDGSTQTSPPWSLSSESGIGCRGGSWASEDNQEIRVSNRSHAANGPNGRQPQYGGRGARTSSN